MAELGTREDGADTARWSCRAVENTVCALWSEQLGRAAGPHDDYYDLGGDSLTMFDFVLAARDRGLTVSASQALRYPTAARLAESVALQADTLPPAALLAAGRGVGVGVGVGQGDGQGDGAGEPVRLVRIGEGDAGRRLYVLHSDSHVQAERDAVMSWTADSAGSDGTLASEFAPPGADGPLPDGDVAEIAEPYLNALRAEQPTGPYRLAGFGHGALLAFELACRLRADGQDVTFLALIDPPAVGAEAGPPANGDDLLCARLAVLAGRFGLSGDETLDEIHAATQRDGWYEGVTARELPGVLAAWARLESVARDYEPAPYDGPALLVQDAAQARRAGQAWVSALSDLQVHLVDYGTEAPDGLLRDARAAQAVRKALEA